MAFLVDPTELKPSLIIFRRGDVKHRNGYCRIRAPKADRYKTASLGASDIEAAKERTYRADAELRFQVKHDVPVFNRPFSHIAKAYADLQKERVAAGQITHHRWVVVKSIIRVQLNRYVGSVQINLVGPERWVGYPLWRKKTGEGRHGRVSDATIRCEMSIFRSAMAYAATKKYVADSHIFKGRLPLAKVCREEFTPEAYRKLHTFARGWIKKAKAPHHLWRRTVAYNFLLIMCNTGMRPPEAKNLRWRDVATRTDNEGRAFVVLHVRGKDKVRNLVAAPNVADYLSRIQEISKASGPDDFVFTTYQGERASTLYANMIQSLFTDAKLRVSSSGSHRSTCCFRHTSAMFRLTDGVDAYFLAKQMDASVQMIEDHYSLIWSRSRPAD